MSNKELTGDVFYPSEDVINYANIRNWDELNKKASEDNLGFWSDMANELEWFSPWDKVMDDSKKPFYKWFTNAKVNIAHNCLDRHVKTHRRNKLALIWEGENGEFESYSYYALHRETNKFANILRSMGVGKGDRVTIYMGRIPEIVMAMLACARIGAMHSVVYGGFSVEALHERIEDSKSKVLIVADGSFQRGKTVPLKDIADEALKRAGGIEHVLVVKRTGQDVNMEEGRDMWYHELLKLPIAKGECPVEELDSEDPLFLLYTSGTTGKPKAILHTHGGYMVGTYTTLKYVFDIHEEDRFWCAADPGWITGHSVILCMVHC